MSPKEMNSLLLTTPRQFSQVKVEIPDIATAGADRILVRAMWASMCGSDIPFFTGNKRHIAYPLPMGAPVHECVGMVVESNSAAFKPGDHVVAIPERDGGLSEFFIGQAAKATRLPDDLDDESTCCLIQPLSTVLNAVDRLGDVSGKSVAVVGLGSIGILFCWLLRKRGAGRIVGIDPIEGRGGAAREMGASAAIPVCSHEVLHGWRQNPASWDPPEICIEAVGHQMDTLNDCLALVQQQGTVLAFGVPDHRVYAIEYETFFRKNAHLVAAVTPNWTEYLAISRDIFLGARAELRGLFTHRLPIREAGKAFTLYERHEDGILKALLDMSAW